MSDLTCKDCDGPIFDGGHPIAFEDGRLCDDCDRKLDEQLCCGGWECGCHGATIRMERAHIAEKNLKARESNNG